MPESFQPSTPHNLAYLFFNKKRIYSLREKDLKVELSYQQLRDMPNVTLGHDRGGKRYFNALASASNYDCSHNLLAYLAVRKKFSLVNFSAPKIELITFGDATGQNHCNTVTYIQCLLREGNERYGIIVQRDNKLVEMWDDRQPRSPCLVFESPSLTRPAVELPLQSMIALHQILEESVKLYSLRTGECVNTMKYPQGQCADLLPQMVFRTPWFYNGNEPCPPGPAVMISFSSKSEYFF